MSVSDHDILELFKQAALEVIGKPFPQLTLDAPIAELGIDSISSTEIIGKLEDTLDVRISDEALMEIRTVRDLSQAVDEARVSKKR